MTFPAKAVTWRGWGYGAGLVLISRGWFAPEPVVPPTPPPVSAPSPPRTIVTTRRSGGGGGGGGGSRARIEYWMAQIARRTDPEIESDSDYALMNITEGATVRALASGLVTRFHDARGRLALKLEADDGTNYYYADLRSYIGAADRRVKSGEAIAKSAREAVPEITRGDRTKALPARSGEVSTPPRLRAVAPVFVEPPVESSPRMWVKLVPVLSSPHTPKPLEWAGVLAPPERRRIPVIAYVAGIGALAALIYALSRPPKKRARRRKR